MSLCYLKYSNKINIKIMKINKLRPRLDVCMFIKIKIKMNKIIKNNPD